jgi:thiol-disulfide isomerase/thioredoxin
MSRSAFRFRFAACCAALLLLLPAGLDAEGPSLVNKPAPRLAGTSLNLSISLAREHGKIVLLNFWATWCGPCRLEMPQFERWQQQYAAKGLQVIGVSIDDSAPPARAFAEKLHLNYPVILSNDKLGEAYGVYGVPVTLLIDRHGIIRARFDGGNHVPAIGKELQTLLSTP